MKKITLLLSMLLVTLMGVSAQTTVTYSFSDGGAVTGLNEAVPGIVIDANVGFGSFKNTASTSPGIYSGALRLYQNATHGGSIKIYANNGVTISQLVVHASDRTGPAAYTVDGGSAIDLAGGDTYTMSNLSAESVVEFYQKDASSSNRIYVGSFDVTYSAAGGPGLPVIKDFLPEPGTVVKKDSTIMVSAVVVTDDAGGIDSVCLATGEVSGFLEDTMRLDYDGDTIYSTSMPMGEEGTFYGQIIAYGANGEVTSSSETNVVVIAPAMTSLPYTEEFATDLGQCYVYSAEGDDKEWEYSSGVASANAYGSSDDQEDWLILPGVDMDAYNDETLDFTTEYKYGDLDATNYLKLFYSTDYEGLDDPADASWIEIPFDLPTVIEDETASGSIDISPIVGQKVYFAFKYVDDASSYRRWYVDNIEIDGVDTASQAPAFTYIEPADGETVTVGDSVNVVVALTVPGGGHGDSVLFVYGDPVIDSVALYWLEAFNVWGIKVPTSLEGENYYRIKAFNNGEVTISDLRTLNCDCPFIDVPDALAATEVEESEFTANWQTSPAATSYLLDVWTEIVGVDASDLFISAYVEGSSNNKYLSIYNGTGTTKDLSEYTLQLFANGETTPSYVNNLEGDLADGSTIVYSNSSAAVYLGATTDLSTCNFNGDDVPVLLKGTDTLDVAGPLGNANNNNYAKDVTLYRKGAVNAPTATYDPSEWEVLAQNHVTDLGNHTMEGGSSQNYILQGDTVEGTSKVITGLDDGTMYYYALNAINDYGCESEMSDTIEVTTDEYVTALQKTAINSVKVFASASVITVKAEGEHAVRVYDIAGAQVANVMMNGEATIPVNRGIYLVRVADEVIKVAVQ